MNPYSFTRTKHFNERQWQRDLDEILLLNVLKTIQQYRQRKRLCIIVSPSYEKFLDRNGYYDWKF